MDFSSDFLKLNEILNPAHDEDEPPARKLPAAGGPGAISAPIDRVPIPKPKPIDNKDIWEEEEVAEDDGLQIDEADTRLRPEYDVLFKQEVGSSDVFLGLDPEVDVGSSCCNEILIKVKLPGETMRDLDLDVTKNRVSLSSKKHVLVLPTPYLVDAEGGSAKFETDTCLLRLVLKVVRPDW